MFENPPSRTELTILSPDDPSARALGFVVCERNGVPLYPIIDGKVGGEPVPATEDLVIGRDYTSCGLMVKNLLWTVERDADGDLCIKCGPNLIGILERGGDDRNCWVVTGMINTRGITALSLST